jgi:hypothetical protein
MFRARMFSLLLLPMVLVTAEGRAGDATTMHENPGEAMLDMKAVSRWFTARFPGEEAMRIEDMRIESHACGCEDKPEPHFPYRIVLVATPKGDMVARPEGQEGAAGIVPLAMRYGDRYCKLESNESCYGAFAHPCEFSDFRYGAALAEYFPMCKSAQDARPER